MTGLAKHVDLHEEGSREGFQIEPGPIITADKIKLIAALAETGRQFAGPAADPIAESGPAACLQLLVLPCA